MTTTRTDSSPPQDLPFKHIGGDASVDLVNTVDWTSRGLVKERLTHYDRLTRWAVEARLITAAQAAALRKLAAASPAEAEAACERARALRQVLKRLFMSIVDADTSDEAWRAFAPYLSEALAHLRLAPEPAARRGAPLASWAWRDADTCLDAPLWPVVWSAAALLVSPEARRLRVCSGPDCGWMFVDRSRNGLRRWCEMETCGTAAKNRRRSRRDHARWPQEAITGGKLLQRYRQGGPTFSAEELDRIEKLKTTNAPSEDE